MAELTENKKSLEIECDCGLLHKISKTENGLKITTFGTKPKIKTEIKEDKENGKEGKETEESDWF